MMISTEMLKETIGKGNIQSAVNYTEEALAAGHQVKAILNDGLIAAMDEVGEKFAKGLLFVPQMLRSAKAMQECMKLIKPYLQEGDLFSKGKVVIGTVQRDLHDIGKNLVAMMLEGAGFDIIDLGVDVSADKFAKKAQEIEPDIIAMSALLSTTMPSMGETIEALRRAKIRDKVKVMIGGAPVTAKFAEDIEADVYAPDAGSAVIAAKKLVGAG
ncbi:MAG: corrinoid protein [Pseudomonadota bacterium]|uniref:Corrinoid protein n=1 Tax=Candidatus Desulfatibia profunda TaxID=2841695 RepID=A0A8J6NJA5_9BACT|nr:corrinoid protein [Candidatus Desulfatibia profunda]MBL7178933.1 corrinoid protein [Desulfobacterales bacterium]